MKTGCKWRKLVQRGEGASKICPRRSATGTCSQSCWQPTLQRHRVRFRCRRAWTWPYRDCKYCNGDITHRTLKLRVHKAKGKNMSLWNPEANFIEKRFQRGQGINGDRGRGDRGKGRGGVSFWRRFAVMVMVFKSVRRQEWHGNGDLCMDLLSWKQN